MARQRRNAMLRVLNENEMEMVSGGDHRVPFDPYNPTFNEHFPTPSDPDGNGIAGEQLDGLSHGGLGVYGQIGGGNGGAEQSTSEEDAPNDPGCRKPPFEFQSWAGYYKDLNDKALGGDNGDEFFVLAGLAKDTNNASLGCKF